MKPNTGCFAHLFKKIHKITLYLVTWLYWKDWKTLNSLCLKFCKQFPQGFFFCFCLNQIIEGDVNASYQIVFHKNTVQNKSM